MSEQNIIVSTECYLTCALKNPRDRWGTLATPRITKGKPSISANEVAIKLHINLPKTLFTRPQIEAHIKVPEDSVVPPVVSMEVIDNIQQIAATQGLELMLTVPEQNGV